MFDLRITMALLVALPLSLVLVLAPMPVIAATQSDPDTSTQDETTARFDAVIDRAIADRRIVGSSAVYVGLGASGPSAAGAR